MFIDLSVKLDEQTPIYPGDLKTQIKAGGILEKDGYSDHYICVGTHVGTHIDAPSHMILNGENIDKISLDQFSGKGICIHVKNKQFDIEALKKISIEEGDMVFFYTEMGDIYNESDYYDNYPDVPESIANYLVEKKIKAVGFDMCSPDRAPFKIHKIFLKNDILIIENLTNLSALIDKEFTIYAFPLKISLDGSPVRVVAEVK